MPTGKTRRGAASAARNLRKASEMREVHKSKGHLRTEVFYFLLDMMTGEPVRAMESAKQLISMPEGEVPLAPLTHIVGDSRYKDWSRIAAAYALGFLPLEKQSGHALMRVLTDRRNSARVRSHAAESLGNLQAQGATSLLRDLLFDANESNAVRKWCIYALGEISSRESRKILDAFANIHPQGVLAAQMNLSHHSTLAKAAL